MFQLRFWIAVTICWLSLLFGIERLHGPFHVESFVYVLAAGLAVHPFTRT